MPAGLKSQMTIFYQGNYDLWSNKSCLEIFDFANSFWSWRLIKNESEEYFEQRIKKVECVFSWVSSLGVKIERIILEYTVLNWATFSIVKLLSRLNVLVIELVVQLRKSEQN